jgi:hypothetical protein
VRSDQVTLYTTHYDHLAQVWQNRSLVFVKTPYNDEIVQALRSFDRAKWVPSEQAWAFPASPRNVWSLQAMTDGSAFDRYLEAVPPWSPSAPERYNSALQRKVTMFGKQREMVAWVLQKRHCILACEMRTGKTWAYIEVMETHPEWEWWFVAPKKVQAEIRNQLRAWGCKVDPKMVSYSHLAKIEGVPQGIIYDEGSHLKGSSKRTQAAIALAVKMDAKYGEQNTLRVLGTGTPEPHSHLDWWNLCESVRPGFLPWGNMYHFQSFLQVREQMTGVHGNQFWHPVQWRDGSPCVKCLGTGKTKQAMRACDPCGGSGKTEDNVLRLKEALANIALVVYKKEVVELPDKEFVTIHCPPTPVMLNVAQSIANSGLSAIEVISKLSQLADGFQYQHEKVVKGDKIVKKSLPTIRGKTPKDAVVRDLLAKHEEVGRFVIYAAYTEAIDHLCTLVQEEGWKVLRCDGTRGWKTWDGRSADDALMTFADKSFDQKIVAIGHPKSMGYGLDLAASPGFLFYSINFDGETFMQAIERGHSINMDKTLGCTIYFIQVLPVEKLVRDNVMGKKNVQDITTQDILRILRENESTQGHKTHEQVRHMGPQL